EVADRRAQPARVAALPEARRDRLVDDAPRIRVGNRAFEPVAHLDAHAPVVLRDDDQHAVVDAPAVDLAAADLPLFGDADRVLLDRLGLRGRDDQDRDLRPLARFERGELGLERRALLAAERSGEIVDTGL